MDIDVLALVLTAAGRAAFVNDTHAGTNAVRVAQIGIAGTAFKPSIKLQSLPGEIKRLDSFAGETVAEDTIHVTIRDDGGDRYPVYGFGLYLDSGVLLGFYVQPEPIMEKSSQAVLLLSADVRFGTVDATSITFGDASFTNPPATPDRLGVVELATQEEVDTGTDDRRALTPRTAARRYAALTGAAFEGPVSVSDPSGTKGRKRALINGDQTGGYFCSDGDACFGSQQATGHARVIAGNKEAIRFTPKGRTLVGTTKDNGIGLLQVDGLVTATTPPTDDKSQRVATTAFVVAAIASAAIGQLALEFRTSVRAGYRKLNGALLLRADYPALWAYAQACGALVSDRQWQADSWGCFSTGDGATTFRLPEVRGEGMRFFDDGRGVDKGRRIGVWQDSQNRAHRHLGTVGPAGEHGHGAWTDSQGWHGHHGNTGGSGEHQHISPWGENTDYPWGATGDRHKGVKSSMDWDNFWPFTSPAGAHGHAFDTEGAGAHGHNVGIAAAGNHDHPCTIAEDGGSEARMRNIAPLAMIRAY